MKRTYTLLMLAGIFSATARKSMIEKHTVKSEMLGDRCCAECDLPSCLTLFGRCEW